MAFASLVVLAFQLQVGAPAVAVSADSLQAQRLPHPTEIGRASLPEVEYTDAYYRRLDIHRAASRMTLPLFALQLVAGQQLFDKSSDAPDWAKVGHRIGATGVAAMFATNLATGVPNMVVAWRDPNDRRRRMFHTTLMLAASAGFTATGLIAERAERDPDARDLHRTIAYSSMGLATLAYFSMLDLFRADD